MSFRQQHPAAGLEFFDFVDEKQEITEILSDIRDSLETLNVVLLGLAERNFDQTKL